MKVAVLEGDHMQVEEIPAHLARPRRRVPPRRRQDLPTTCAVITLFLHSSYPVSNRFSVSKLKSIYLKTLRGFVLLS